MDAAEGDHVAIRILRLVGQPQGIAHVVGHVLDVPGLVAVRQNDGVAFFFQA